ncbi:MAG: polyprenyl synthetase family protein [Nitrososphaerales archaeon]|nr:polyprenyl synthetase family protein [Nitrososphaerales archaeon]
MRKVEKMDLINILWERRKDSLVKIEEALKKELIKYSNTHFYEPLLYAISNGKRLRPLILLISAECVDKGDSKIDPLPAAVAIELLHTESLIHDDIIDREEFRRGKVAFHVKYGYEASILTADFILAIILDIASRYNDYRIAKELSLAVLRMCEGEFNELKINLESRLNLDDYINIISQKTASLFQTAACIGGIIGGGHEEEINALSNYGLQLGIAYQIHDDIHDWSDQSKITKVLMRNLKDPIPRLKAMVEHHVKKAKDELKTLRESQSKNDLIQLVEFITIRE